MIRTASPVIAILRPVAPSTLSAIRLDSPSNPTTNVTLVATPPTVQHPLVSQPYSTGSTASFHRPGHQQIRPQPQPTSKRVLLDSVDAGQPATKLVVRQESSERRKVVLVQRNNDPGLPVIQSVRGNVSSAKPNPAAQMLSRYFDLPYHSTSE